MVRKALPCAIFAAALVSFHSFAQEKVGKGLQDPGSFSKIADPKERTEAYARMFNAPEREGPD